MANVYLLVNLERVAQSLGAFFAGPRLQGNARRTYRLHAWHVVINAVAMGILGNAPTVAVRAAGASDWHMALTLALSGVGMLLVLYLGGVMAGRAKMAFVFWPGVGYALCSAAMVLFVRQPLPFMFLAGMGMLFETLSRPAVTAIVRLNYAVEQRGHVAATLRRASALAFLVGGVVCARLLDLAPPDRVMVVVRMQLLTASILALVAFGVFRLIRVVEEPAAHHAVEGVSRILGDCLGILRRDGTENALSGNYAATPALEDGLGQVLRRDIVAPGVC